MVRRKEIPLDQDVPRVPDRFRLQLNQVAQSAWFQELEVFNDSKMSNVTTDHDLHWARVFSAARRMREAEDVWIKSQKVQPLGVSDATWNFFKNGDSSKSPGAEK